MSSTTAPTRLFTMVGGLLAAAGLAAALAVGPAAFADTADVEANAEVASTITLTADDAAFTLTGLPGETDSTTSGLTAETNNDAGYNVTVVADQADLLPADTEANTDSIPVSSLEVQDSGDVYTALDTETAVTVHTQDDRSADGGDAVTASYQLTVPFVNADTYSGGLTFTAAAN